MRVRTFRIVMAILAVVLFLSFTIYASAQTIEELLRNPGLSDSERNAIAKAISKSTPSSSLPVSLKGMVEWQEMGDAFATTIKTVCETLNVEVNRFLVSDVGKLTAAVIVYKMVGKDIIRIILYTSIWIGVTFFIMVSIKFIHMKKKVKQKVEHPVNKDEWVIVTAYEDRFGWPGDDGAEWKMASLFVHIIAWFVLSCIIAFYVI